MYINRRKQYLSQMKSNLVNRSPTSRHLNALQWRLKLHHHSLSIQLRGRPVGSWNILHFGVIVLWKHAGEDRARSVDANTGTRKIFQRYNYKGFAYFVAIDVEVVFFFNYRFPYSLQRT